MTGAVSPSNGWDIIIYRVNWKTKKEILKVYGYPLKYGLIKILQRLKNLFFLKLTALIMAGGVVRLINILLSFVNVPREL